MEHSKSFQEFFLIYSTFILNIFLYTPLASKTKHWTCLGHSWEPGSGSLMEEPIGDVLFRAHNTIFFFFFFILQDRIVANYTRRFSVHTSVLQMLKKEHSLYLKEQLRLNYFLLKTSNGLAIVIPLGCSLFFFLFT